MTCIVGVRRITLLLIITFFSWVIHTTLYIDMPPWQSSVVDDASLYYRCNVAMIEVDIFCTLFQNDVQQMQM